MEDKKLPSNERPSKGGPASVPKLKRSDKSRRKMEKGHRELDIYEEIQNELDECIKHDVDLCNISISEVMIALNSEPDWSGNIEYL